MVSWDGQKPSKPKKQGPQKCTKKSPLFWTRIEASRGKKGKIRYVLSGFSANPTYPEFCGQKNSDFSGRMEVAKSLFERVAPTPRNPYKTSAKPLLGESGRTPGTLSKHYWVATCITNHLRCSAGNRRCKRWVDTLVQHGSWLSHAICGIQLLKDALGWRPRLPSSNALKQPCLHWPGATPWHFCLWLAVFWSLSLPLLFYIYLCLYLCLYTYMLYFTQQGLRFQNESSGLHVPKEL